MVLPYNPHPGLLLDLFFFKATIYNLMLAIGIITIPIIGIMQAKKKKKNIKHALWFGFLAMLGLFIGAKLFYIISRWSWLMEDTSRWNLMISGGFVAYGGIIVGALIPLIYSKIKKINYWEYADLFALGAPLANLANRIGCFFNGCCYGKQVVMNIPWAVYYKDALRHPTQIYHGLSALIIFFILLRLNKKKNFNGFLILSYFLLYSLFRFIVEFFRLVNNKYIMFSLTGSQLIAIVVFSVSLAVIWKKSNKFKDLKI
jgi:phosphatidylglycerol:prolipoprotein diacylglycerol transferase